MMGRPSKIDDPEKVARMIEALKKGNHVESSCAYAGYSKHSHYRWMENAEGEEPGNKFRDYSDAVKNAIGISEYVLVERWRTLIDNLDAPWAAIATFLERRFPDRWGKRQAIQMTTKAERPPKPEEPLPKLSKETAVAIEELLYQAELDQAELDEAERMKSENGNEN